MRQPYEVRICFKIFGGGGGTILPEEIKEGFIAAMLKLNEPDKRHLLAHVYNPDGYERADPARFDAVAQLAHARGVM